MSWVSWSFFSSSSSSCPPLWLKLMSWLGCVLRRPPPHLCSNPAMRTVAHGTPPLFTSTCEHHLIFRRETLCWRKRGKFLTIKNHLCKPDMRSSALDPFLCMINVYNTFFSSMVKGWTWWGSVSVDDC